MTALGSLSSINLIAGAGILGNIGGVPIGPNVGLTANINSYTSVAVVNQFAGLASSGYVSINVAANSFPALTNAIPTAYQGNLGSGTMTGAISSQSANILGGGDLGKFEQVLGAAYGFVLSTNELIKSVLNANSDPYRTGFVNQDNISTGGLSKWTVAFVPLSQDLAQLGVLIDLANLGNLGSPGSVFRQLYSQVGAFPALNTALLDAGISQETVDTLATAELTDSDQLIMYQVMTNITGTTLQQILKILKVTTPGITTMADLLNPVRIFPRSYITFTTTTNNGLRGIYLDTAGTVNTALITELPSSVIAPLQGKPQPNVITYSQLKKIIPADQALANKAIQVALEQVKTIFNSNLTLLSAATVGLETNKGLSIINSLSQPLPQAVVNFYESTFAQGSGPDGLLLLTDVIGTPTGWVHNNALSNTVIILNQMTANNAFANLTNSSNGVYTVMANTISGVYTTSDGMDPPTYTTTIPGGLPGAGSYTGDSAGNSIASAFTAGLTPNLVANINIIVSAYPTQVANANSAFNAMSAQISGENNNLNSASVQIANLIPGTRPNSLVTNLPQYGLNTAEGGAAFVLESVADISTQGGQAIIGTMREARNQVRLSDAGIQTEIVVSDVYPEPQATLSTGTYSVQEAVNQKII